MASRDGLDRVGFEGVFDVGPEVQVDGAVVAPDEVLIAGAAVTALLGVVHQAAGLHSVSAAVEPARATPSAANEHEAPKGPSSGNGSAS
jgi:hypothetical protein